MKALGILVIPRVTLDMIFELAFTKCVTISIFWEFWTYYEIEWKSEGARSNIYVYGQNFDFIYVENDCEGRFSVTSSLD